MKRYVLFPGFIISPYDGDKHFINAPTLARLYGVNIDDCLVVKYGDAWAYQHQAGDIKLHPLDNGKYDKFMGRDPADI